MYASVKLFEDNTKSAAAKLGITFGLLVLTRGFVVPLLALLIGLAALSFAGDHARQADARKSVCARPGCHQPAADAGHHRRLVHLERRGASI